MKSKKLWFILLLTITTLTLVYTFYAHPSFKIATGYGAKYLGSYSYLSNLPDSIVKKDLDFSVVKYVDFEYNKEENSLEADVFGIVEHEAEFYDAKHSKGCKLDHDDNDETTKELPTAKHEYTDFNRTWPQGDKLKDTVFPEVNLEKINKIIKQSLKENSATRAVTIAYKNQLIAEHYAPGVNINTRLLGWSMTKTMSGALIGNLEKNGLINRDDPAGIPEWKDDKRKNITVNDLLQMSSGLKWTEDYSKISEVTRMLYMEPDFAQYAISRPLEFMPGTHWYYSSGTSNILSQIIRSKFNTTEEYWAFPNDSLLKAIDMRSAVLETDNAGNYVFSSYCWATARDWTRFGLLYLNNGNWFGHQVFTPEWVDYSTTPATKSDGKYGVQMWLNASKKMLPSAPADTFFEKGYGGQRVVIIPSMDLVVVLLSGRQDGFDFDKLLGEILTCIQ